MFYTRIRFFLIFLFAGLGILLHLQMGLSAAWYLYAGALLLLLTYFLFGPVWMAFRLLGRGRIDEAERLLKQVKRPGWLIPRNRAYYHFTKGLIHLQRKELTEGEQQLQFALDTGLKRPNDQALAYLNLAHIAFLSRQYDKARQYLQNSRALKTSDLMLQERQQEMEKALGRVP